MHYTLIRNWNKIKLKTKHKFEGDTVKSKSEIRISVRNLVEFIFRSGDIDSQFTSNSRALEGTKAHQKIQKDNGYAGYTPEVSLKYTLEYKSFNFAVEGRADGIILTMTPLQSTK